MIALVSVLESVKMDKSIDLGGVVVGAATDSDHCFCDAMSVRCAAVTWSL